MALPKVVAGREKDRVETGWVASNNPVSTTFADAQREELLAIFDLPPSAEVAIPGPGEEAFYWPWGHVVLYEYHFLLGLHFPFTPLARSFMAVLNLSPGQLMPQI